MSKTSEKSILTDRMKQYVSNMIEMNDRCIAKGVGQTRSLARFTGSHGCEDS